MLQQGRLTLREVGNDGNPSGAVLDSFMRPLQGKYITKYVTRGKLQIWDCVKHEIQFLT